MSTSTKCDRCGNLMTRPVLEVGDLSICETTHRYDEMRYDRTLDLCNECMESFDRWFRGVIE